MPTYSSKSLRNLYTCHDDLVKVFLSVIVHYDCSIICGHRDESRQNAAFKSGHSKLQWPDSSHNRAPSTAVDATPYPPVPDRFSTADEKHRALSRYYLFAGRALSTAESMGVKLVWGGDWDSDGDFSDQRFDDLAHFQLARPSEEGNKRFDLMLSTGATSIVLKGGLPLSGANFEMQGLARPDRDRCWIRQARD